MNRIEAMKSIKKAYTRLNSIESLDDLKRAKLSLADYYNALNIYKDLKTPSSYGITYFENVALFYESCDFLVVPEKGHFLIWTEA